MSLSAYDPFPLETISFNELKSTNSPLLFLDYGILYQYIVPIICSLRKKIRDDLILFYINNTRNDFIISMLRNIKINYSLSFIYKFNKYNVFKWYIDSKLPIYYIQNTYNKFIKGPPLFNKFDIVSFNNNLYLIIDFKIKKVITYKFSNNLLKKFVYDYPLINSNTGVIYGDSIKPLQFTLDPWNIIKTDISYNHDTCFYHLNKDNIEFKIRKLFWDTHISNTFHHSISIHHFFNLNYQVRNLKYPPSAIHFSENMKNRWIQEWNVINSFMNY